ncbi:MAG: multifunctional oxoglutarate decarboxylase/oxoglutarate dehydrogenase thiamine pyrophosphate-binding subunit/dihydrolipoyllysine-residue succinyltransferase subunit [Acidimicrobiia bacterium]|nr:multifunctional oxoglutarate decarboxylase/oxoglutarate dehydrogenase thiamine pyrophosphate-binding subunit/dihydrolipoyllysine-residue succinyltransferase subunit [Acidimicrobiia bacterium]
MTSTDPRQEFGPNAGVVQALRERWLSDPNSVPQDWQDYFAKQAAAEAAPEAAAHATSPTAAAPPTENQSATASDSSNPNSPPGGSAESHGNQKGGDSSATAEPDADHDAGLTVEPLRGAAARIVENMEESLGVPTATSVRTIPTKLLEVNRRAINDFLARADRKVSFTHLIAYAAVRAISMVPGMNARYEQRDGKPFVLRPEQVHLGIAVDMKRRGGRTLLVPNIKNADTMDFAEFVEAYDTLVDRVRAGKITPDDFVGTTMSITNPGMIGTELSVPRLMAGQGVILGVGAMSYPKAMDGSDPRVLGRLGIGRTITFTSTYDHRIIQGAESGEFLGTLEQLLRGGHNYYQEVFQALGMPEHPARWERDKGEMGTESAMVKQMQVQQLANMYRVRGHLAATLDPLGRWEPVTHPELDPDYWDLSIWDLEREFFVPNLADGRRMPLSEILDRLKRTYTRSTGYEYMQMQDPHEKRWIQTRVEVDPEPLSYEERASIMGWLNSASAFEAFLAKKYLGHKRFGIEGAESLIPMLAALLDQAGAEGVRQAVIGMAHRGRLNVLSNIVGKSYLEIFNEFEMIDPSSTQGSGDVKYHLGATGSFRTLSDDVIGVTLAANPSHLEAVDPVCIGMTRARQELDEQGTVSGRQEFLPILIHGDATFAGQGVVAETLNMSQVPGYRVGGTIHLVVNNQVGFTTDPSRARSSVYATDVAKMVQAPIFHVNGDDPEACVRAIRLACSFRNEFAKDVVVDLVCYRRHGHNETDEPSFTQPSMYALIDNLKPVRERYTDSLVRRGEISTEQAEAALADYQDRLNEAFSDVTRKAPTEPHTPHATTASTPFDVLVETGVDRGTLNHLCEVFSTPPEGFTVHPKLQKVLDDRGSAMERDSIDWALAEHLAFGSLLIDGHPLRLAGQDSARGTFSQRHAVWVDYKTERQYTPLAHVADPQPELGIWNSTLSEYAALGFEWGYAHTRPETLVLWEAQFGDFVNGAQIIIDQFLVASEEKWGQRCGLVLLLPHGLEGQGPEHSSARIERFMTLAAGENMRLAYPTTAAQYFHLLRSQKKLPLDRPLVVFTPKRYLRMKETASSVKEFTSGHFRRVLQDSNPIENPKRVLVCSGKIGHELMAARDKRNLPVSVVRVEQLHPFPFTELASYFASLSEPFDVRWVQEEPRNMGPASFVSDELRNAAGGDAVQFEIIARQAMGSPASGSLQWHEKEQAELIDAAFFGV